MAENSKIEWCDHTWNPWLGCTKVSPACDHCYAAEMMDKPTWELVEDAGTVMVHWRGSPGENTQGLPLGPAAEVAEKLAAWLAQRDFGE